MVIGFDITALHVALAGVFNYDYGLLRALLELDHENEFLLLDFRSIHGGSADPPEIRELCKRGGNVVKCTGLRHRRLARWRPMQGPRGRTVAGWVDHLLFWPWSVAADAVMRRRLARVLDGVDVFHSSDVLLWRHPRALNVLTLYDLTVLFFPEYHTADTREMQRRKYRFAQEEADVVIAISQSTKQDIVDNLQIPEERVHVVHGGVGPEFRPMRDREALAQVLAPLGLVPGGYIVHVGTIEPRKNLVRLVEAYARVRKMLPPPAPKLVLAGAAGWQVSEVFERIETLGLDQEVVYLGRVPAEVLPALYNGAAVLAYPSLYEGFGLPPLEAMACGVPVVASNVSSLPEVVGDAGVLVDPSDTGALAAAMATLLTDGAQRLRLSRAGLARAAQFSWERAASEALGVYRMGCPS